MVEALVAAVEDLVEEVGAANRSLERVRRGDVVVIEPTRRPTAPT